MNANDKKLSNEELENVTGGNGVAPDPAKVVLNTPGGSKEVNPE